MACPPVVVPTTYCLSMTAHGHPTLRIRLAQLPTAVLQLSTVYGSVLVVIEARQARWPFFMLPLGLSA